MVVLWDGREERRSTAFPGRGTVSMVFQWLVSSFLLLVRGVAAITLWKHEEKSAGFFVNEMKKNPRFFQMRSQFCSGWKTKTGIDWQENPVFGFLPGSVVA